MRKPICKLTFRQMSATDLDTFSQGVLIGIYQNTLVFATPVIAEVDLQTIYNDYVTAYVDYEQYGLTKKTAYLNAKSSLVDALNTLVVYVDSIAMGDVSIIALSGFVPSREVDEPSQPLGKISNFTVKQTENSGELFVNISSLAGFGRLSYGCICVEGEPIDGFTMDNGRITIPSGAAMVVLDFNKSRQKLISGLTAGIVYYIYVFANNTVSVSPLSDFRKIMAT